MAPNTHADGEDVALAVQIHKLLQTEREWTESRFVLLESHIQDGNETLQGAVAAVNVQLAGLRCPEHRQKVEQLEGNLTKLQGEVRRRQLIWGGAGFASGLAAAAGALSAMLSYIKGGN